MNCCNDPDDCSKATRDCPVRAQRQARGLRSCDELGVCQGGASKRFPFAPGVIEGPEEAPSYITRLEAVILVVLVLAAIGSALARWLA